MGWSDSGIPAIEAPKARIHVVHSSLRAELKVFLSSSHTFVWRLMIFESLFFPTTFSIPALVLRSHHPNQ